MDLENEEVRTSYKSPYRVNMGLLFAGKTTQLVQMSMCQ